jgi:hypothetical protein
LHLYSDNAVSFSTFYCVSHLVVLIVVEYVKLILSNINFPKKMLLYAVNVNAVSFSTFYCVSHLVVLIVVEYSQVPV